MCEGKFTHRHKNDAMNIHMLSGYELQTFHFLALRGVSIPALIALLPGK